MLRPVSTPSSRPADRPHSVRYSQRAVTYTWDLATTPVADADGGHGTVQAVLTITWTHHLHRYAVTVHHQRAWIEQGIEHHTRDPHSTITLATKTAGRFGPQTLRRYAFSALMSLTDARHPYFLPQHVAHQDDLFVLAS